MNKMELGPQGFVYPMPMTLVGVDLETGPNFMPVAWVNRVQYSPPRLVVGMGKTHATSIGIREHGEFSVCVPSVDMMEVTDWCGLNSALGAVNKATPFTILRGSLEFAPMIAECPLGLECRVYEVVDLGSHDVFVADIVETWSEKRFLDEAGKPDIEKMRPFLLTMTDNRYWAVGEYLGDAWSVGKGYDPADSHRKNA